MSKGVSYTFFLGVILLIALIISFGYFSFRYFASTVSKNFESYGLILLAIVAGTATFFSPCSFPTLPAYLTSFYNVKRRDISKIVYYGSLTAIGIIVFNVVFGSLIGLLGGNFAKSFSISSAEPNLYVRIFRGVVGSVLILLGLSQYSIGIGLFHRITHYGNNVVMRSSSSTKALTYGFAYNIIGIGCVGPILSGLVLFAFASGGFVSALTSFISFSLTMAFLMIMLSFLVGLAKKGTVEKLAEFAPKIKKFSGMILLIVGLYLLSSSIFISQFVAFLFPR